MKKRISLVLVLIMLITIAYPCQSIISDEINRKSVGLFCNLVSDINEKYQLTSEDYEYSYNQDNPNATENRLIVKTKDKIENTSAIDSVYALDYAILQYADKADMLKEYDALTEQGYTVEKDKYFHTAITDAYGRELPETWAYDDAGAEYAKANISSTKQIIVGVLDTGVDYNHPSVKDRITDTTLDFIDNSGSSMDENGHGTSVASIIAQSTPSNVKIKPYKVMGADGFSTLTSVISAMEYILSEKNKPDILNLSLSGYNFEKKNTIEAELVSQLVASGITVCVSSGNDNLPTEYLTPASNDNVITVGAYDYNNCICTFSNYGTQVDIAAPGLSVYAADVATGGYTGEFSGTSAACPFVSAACAYVLMQNPTFTPAQVKEKVKSSAIDMGEDDRMYFGSGKLSIANLVGAKTYAAPVPSVKGGTYNSEQIVEFKNIPAGTELVFTFEKSVPSSTNGEVYTAPFIVDNEMQINYVLMKNGKYVSPIKSQYYTIQYYCDESEFEIGADGGITAFNSIWENNIVVPDTINGVKPTYIAQDAFTGTYLTGIVLPDSVTSIDTQAFYQSYDLRHITAKGLKNIAKSAFEECYALRDVNMPNVETLGMNAFYNCTMLHSVNFENSLKSLNQGAFGSAGVLNLNFTNLLPTACNSNSIFENSTLMSCSITGVKTLGERMFMGCAFLRNLNAPNVTLISRYVFADCYFLGEFDMPNVTAVKGNAFAECYIDTLYAPALITLDTPGVDGFGRQNHSRVINFPLLTKLENYYLRSMDVQELYFKSVETMTKNAFDTLCYLNIVYMPKVQMFYTPVIYSPGFPGPLEMVWIPSSKNATAYATTKLLFAPSAQSVSLSAYNTAVVVSNKAAQSNISATSEGYQNKVFPSIIAPKNSIVWNQWKTNNPTAANALVDSNDVVFNGLDENGNLTYNVNGSTVAIPFSFVSDYWNEYTINESRYTAPYMFVFDFNNDNIINAKDYAELIKLEKTAVL